MIFKEQDIAIYAHRPTGVKDLETYKSTRFHKPTGVYFALVSGKQSAANLKKVSNEYYYVGDSQVREVENFDEVIEFKGTPYKFMYETDKLTKSNTNEQLGQIENALTDDGYSFIAVSEKPKPRGTKVAYYIPTENNSESGFLYFEVAQLNSKGETIDKKTFDGKTQKSFFESVDYFEQLVAKREPQPEQEDPSVGIFIYLKGRDCFAEVFGNKVRIYYDDVDKVFTPPVKKKFGRLNMYAVDKPEYEVIKGKFALTFDEALTEKFAKQFADNMNPSPTPNVDFFVYKMTPYDTSEDGQSDDTPQDVNDDDLNINDIEGEDPKDMTGENADQDQDQNGDGGDGDPQDGQGEDGDGGDGDPQDGQGEDGQGEDGDGGDGDGQDGDGKGDKSDRQGGDDFDGNADDTGSDKGDGDGDGGDLTDQTGDGGDLGGDKPEPNAANEDELNEIISSQTEDAVEALSDDLGGVELQSYFRRKGRVERYLSAFTQSELQEKFYDKLNIPKGTSKADFVKTMSEITDKYLGNE